MNTGLEFKIPREVAEVPDLSLVEAVALSHILEHPRCSNRTLARLLRQTERGVEAMLCRLRERRLIHTEGGGRGRRILLAFHVEHKKCGEKSEPELHVKCDHLITIAPSKQNPACPDFVSARWEFFGNCMDAGNYDAARSHLKGIRKRVESGPAMPDSEKEKILGLVKVEEDRCCAFALGAKAAEGLTSSDRMKLAIALSTASVEKLAALREQVEVRALEGSVQSLLLAEVIEMGTAPTCT